MTPVARDHDSQANNFRPWHGPRRSSFLGQSGQCGVAGTRHPALGTVTKIRFLPGEIHATVTVTPVHLSVRGLAAAAYLGELAKGRAISNAR